MSDERLPAEHPEQGLVFDPRASSPLLRRGVLRLAQPPQTSLNDALVAAPMVLWSTPASSWQVDRHRGVVYVLTKDSLSAIASSTGQVRWRIESRPEDREIWTSEGSGSRTLGVTGGIVLFVRRPDEDQATEVDLCAVDATTGRPRWTKRVSAEWDQRTCLGDTVFVTRSDFLGGRLVALDAATGHERFRFDLAQYPSRFPLIDPRRHVDIVPGVVYASIGESRDVLSAIDTSSAAIRWRLAPRPRSVWPRVHEGVVYASHPDSDLFGFRPDPGTSAVVSLDATSGRERWRVLLDDFVCEGVFPAATGSGLYVTARRRDANGRYAGRLFSLDAATGRERWRVSGQPFCAVSARGELVYALDDALRAFDAASGTELWRFGHDACSSTGSNEAPTVVGGIVYHGTGLFDGYLVALDARTGTERWRFERMGDHALLDCVAIADGVAYVGGERALHALHAATGRELWRLEVPEEITVVDVVDGVVYANAGSREPLDWGEPAAVLYAVRHNLPM